MTFGRWIQFVLFGSSSRRIVEMAMQLVIDLAPAGPIEGVRDGHCPLAIHPVGWTSPAHRSGGKSLKALLAIGMEILYLNFL
jgi:hypothetical protein